MQILVEVPASLPDAIQCTPQQFIQEAKLAMGVKLYEMKRLSSGMAASLVGMGRVQFLGELHRYGIAVIDLDDDELAEDIINARSNQGRCHQHHSAHRTNRSNGKS